jgi:hypothetical protein
MARRPSIRHADVRGAARLVIDATTGVADLVEAVHERVARVPGLAPAKLDGRVGGIGGLVYKSVRGVTRVVGGSIDALMALLGPALPTGDSSPEREAVIAALNGVLGDYLAATSNPLATPMALRREGRALTLEREALAARMPDATRRLVVLAHGLCMNDLQWERGVPAAPAADTPADAAVDRAAGTPHDHGATLARDLGMTAVYLHYNSGRHVSLNGRAFADRLEALVAAWPVPVKRLVILGNSMGGLVARSAHHYGTVAGHAWPLRLRSMVFLGTPHHGAPMERGGHWIDVLLQSTPYTAPFARLGRVRSAGITDLRHGSALDEDWHGRDRFAHGHDTRRPLPLPDKVACYAIAATTSPAKAGAPAVERVGVLDSRASTLAGDGLVPVASALGLHDDPRFALAFAPLHRAIAWNCGHLELLSSPAVYAQLRAWLGPSSR